MATYQRSKDLVLSLLEKRAGPYSPLKKIFEPHLEQLRRDTGVMELNEIMFNALNGLYGPGKCEICEKPTKLYPARGGWATFCSKACMNSVQSSRHNKSESTKHKRGTNISSQKVRNAAQKTFIGRYGVSNPSNVEKFKKRREQTYLDRFGESTPLKNSKVKAKIRHTMLDKYGGFGNAALSIKNKAAQSRRKSVLASISNRLTEWAITTDPVSWQGSHTEKLELIHECGTKVDAYLWYGQNLFDPKCPKCHTSSKPQRKVAEFINSLGFDVIINNRSIISPLEIDIVVADTKIAIEVNGLYFHGEKNGKHRNYHLIKTDLAKAAGYQLLHFTDYDIDNRWGAVELCIKAKLGVLSRLDARKLQLSKISKDVSAEFLNRVHMQGSSKCSWAYGLFDGADLVAVATFGKSRFDKSVDYELLRFAASASIRGGASKLIHAFSKDHSSSIVSYADRRWSDGGLYDKIGFDYVSSTKPGYWYFKGGGLVHRSMFQKKKITSHENAHKTEREIMESQGWDRYWDCGHLKYIKK